MPANQLSAIQNSGGISFQVVGDTGGIKHPEPQQIVSMAMEADFSVGTEKPSFFYHLGDVIYFYGESSEYYPQFYEPYAHYPAPIFAIPGNHDGGDASTIASGQNPLEPFVTNFCAKEQAITPDAREIKRLCMIQPNVYWTLYAPFVSIVGLYSNVPEGGAFDKANTQLDWFENELLTAPKGKALIVCVHHPPISADSHHGGSKLIFRYFQIMHSEFALSNDGLRSCS